MLNNGGSSLNIYSELVNILELTKNSKSIDHLYSEFLKKSSQHLGIERSYLAFFSSKKILSYPPNATIYENFDTELKINLPFLGKFFESNPDFIFTNADEKNAGYNFLKILNCNSLLILPVHFNNCLLAAAFYTSQSSFIYTKAIEEVKMLSHIFTIIADDIEVTEKNNALENKLIQAQKLETLGKLAGGIAHDFSNILSSIFGSVTLLRKKIPESEETKRLLDIIEQSSIRAKDLTKGLLTYGKPTPKRRAVVDSAKLSEELIKMVQQTFPKSVSFVPTVDENLYSFLGNETEIFQVILNLCINAKEAIKTPNGKVILKVRNITIDKNNVNQFPLMIPGDYIRFTIRDNGSGISDDNLNKIFDPYFSTKKKEQTSGLGLYVSYGIIKGHKGHIDVKSIIDKGTSFDVLLPALTYPKSATTSAYRIILIADDEPMLIDLLGELLEANEFNVIKVGSGNEALKLLKEEIKVDLIILDYHMPNMNGLECTKKIRKFDKKTPIILSTGSISINEDISLKDYGISSIVPKPYEFDTLLSTINKLI